MYIFNHQSSIINYLSSFINRAWQHRSLHATHLRKLRKQAPPLSRGCQGARVSSIMQDTFAALSSSCQAAERIVGQKNLAAMRSAACGRRCEGPGTQTKGETV